MLPTTKTPPKSSLADLSILVYGPAKFGKSEFCSKAEDALFLATEPGLNSIEAYQEPIPSWEKLLSVCAELAEGKHRFKTIVLDTVDQAYKLCAEHICRQLKITHESDLPQSKGYSVVNNEFHRVLRKLAFLPYGLFLVAHSQEKEIETRTGRFMKAIPTLPEKPRKIVLELVDVILFCDFEVSTDESGAKSFRRVLRTKPSPNFEAGDRTRRFPAVLPWDDPDPAVNYARFVEAFERAGVAPEPPTVDLTPAFASAPATTEKPATARASR